MSPLGKLQLSQGSVGWSPVYSCLQTERDLERSPFKEEKVSHVSHLTIYFPGEVGEELARKAEVLFGGVKFAGAGYSSVQFRIVEKGCVLWSMIFKK